jgi:dTDP-N-acetylfucosamine:lipid II N-acetylfucosaminyltransferase
MEILHVAYGGVIMSDYIRFLNENFDIDKHSVVILGNATDLSPELLEHGNAYILDIKKPRQFFGLLSYIMSAELIILHSLGVQGLLKLFFLLNPSIMRKSVWVAWGGDLYQWKRNGKDIVSKVSNCVNYMIRKRIRYFVGIFPPDIDFFKKEFQSSAKTFYASYVGGLYSHFYNADLGLLTLEEKIARGETINIQIGHQCNPILNHIEVLEQLHKFKDENIRIFVPLSYGDMGWGDLVEDRALSLFGHKVHCMREMMPKDDYLDYLSTIDIAIFNTPRQIGLGNITPLLFMKKKIFVPEGSVMYDFYTSLGIPIVDYNRVKSMDFNEFTHPVDMSKGKEYVLQNGLNKKKKVEMWRNVFNASLGEEDKG